MKNTKLASENEMLEFDYFDACKGALLFTATRDTY